MSLLPRTGIGIDVHRWASDERPLWLAGVSWPDQVGLDGHSDGDVVSHAMCDALFSAAGIGDLGQHFGVDRPEFAGAHGVAFLGEAARLVRAAGFEIGNVAVQLIANRPKLGPRREEIEQTLGAALGAQVSVAATTTDGVGITGRGEAAAAIATAMLWRPVDATVDSARDRPPR